MAWKSRACAFGALIAAMLTAPAAGLTPEAVATSQNVGAAALAAGKAVPPMWRLADEDSEIWLLGTFHILPPALDWRSNALAAAADSAETFWFEAEVDTPAVQQTTVQFLRAEGFNKPGVTLTNILGADYGARLAKAAADVGLSLSVVDTMRPWQAFLALSVQFIVLQGFDPDSGVETVLLKEARARGRQLLFFETVEQQLSLFTSLSPETEKKLLVVTLRDWDGQKADFDNLFEAWRTGDADAIDRLMNDALRREAPEAHEILVTKRNEAWAEEIAKTMAGRGKFLVAVGAGHLVGEGSVPALLREKGFTVERYGVSE